MDGASASAVAQLLDLSGEGGGIGAALQPAVMQIEAVVVDHAGAVGGRDEKFIDVSGLGETNHGAAAEAEFASDRAQAVAALNPLVELLIPLAGPRHQRARPTMDVDFSRRCPTSGCRIGCRRQGFA
ncbi:hypothetical protein [Streptomyces sp. BA2]|uniref:hypothetical protein n=1 Tax=Streptomyces sp. BA2 TaxID=436595 RepID=UPI0013229337|nr:hypothetical protein [Streptomyces sp. BA2]MWA08121.1 hypothetical protein [Streptomyces sp. BA2]